MIRPIDIVLFDKGIEKELKGSVFITGYTGIGLVGYLASRHIAYTLDLKRIGFIKTRYMPEITFYKQNIGIVYPFELYYGEINSKKILVMISHSVPSARERTLFIDEITRWVKKIGVEEGILIGGLDPAVREEEGETYRWIPVDGTWRKLDAKILEEKHVVGLLALTIMFFEAYKIPSVAVFPYAELYRPDPRATAIAVKLVSDIVGVNISVDTLYEEAKRLESIEAIKDEITRKIYEAEERGRKTHTLYI